MPKITFIDFEGNATDVDANVGDTIMDTAVTNDVTGIDADCGGACACATCHVYIDSNWLAKLIEPDEIESEMLSVAEEVKDNSRLSCQIEVTDEMDGIIVHTPESQF